MRSLEKSIGSHGAEASQPPALAIETVEVDVHCTGSRWTAVSIDHLARIIAIVAMGQAAHAAHIIAQLLPSKPAFDDQALRANAKRTLSVTKEREVYRYHRDGLIFEVISWAAAQ